MNFLNGLVSGVSYFIRAAGDQPRSTPSPSVDIDERTSRAASPILNQTEPTPSSPITLSAVESIPSQQTQTLEVYKKRIEWRGATYELSQTLPSGSQAVWEDLVDLYQSALMNIPENTIDNTITEFDLIPKKDGGMFVSIPKENENPIEIPIANSKEFCREILRLQTRTKLSDLTKVVPFCGFKRNPNICYLNAAVSLILTTPSLRRRLNQDLEEDHPLKKVLNGYQTSNEPLDLEPLRSYLTQKNQKLSKDKEEDAQEVLKILLSELKESNECSRIARNYGDSELLSQSEEKMDFPEITPGSAPDDQLTLQDLALSGLELKQDATLRVNGEDKKLTKTIYQFATTPSEILVSIPRFHFEKGVPKKNSKKVQINENLTIELPKECFRDDKKETYFLKGFVVHLGNTPQTGHYIHYFEDKDLFWSCNGPVVTEISREEFFEEAQSMYIAQLEKKETTEPPVFDEESDDEELLSIHSSSSPSSSSPGSRYDTPSS